MSDICFGFVVLVYRNSGDIKELVDSIRKEYRQYTCHILVVNSFFDEDTNKVIKAIASELQCDYLCVENKGYSYGNNRGIEYILKHYSCDYIIVANPDTCIVRNNFSYENYLQKKVVIAPCIKNLNGKQQNPYWVINNSFAEFLIYMGHKKKSTITLYFGIALNKLIRELFHLKRHYRSKKVFAAHGSYVIFSREVILQIGLPYDENMFLFAEENLLAHKLLEQNVPVMYTDDIGIIHKEDGSLKLSKIDENQELTKSIIYYYEKIKRING